MIRRFFFYSSYSKYIGTSLPSQVFVCQVDPDLSWTSDVWLHLLRCLQGNHPVTQSLERTKKIKNYKATCISHISNYYSRYRKSKNAHPLNEVLKSTRIRMKCRIFQILSCHCFATQLTLSCAVVCICGTAQLKNSLQNYTKILMVQHHLLEDMYGHNLKHF